MTERREDIALKLAEKLWEFDRSERWHTDRPKQDWLEAVAALLRPHVWEWIPAGERLPDENNEYLVSENEVGVSTADWRDGEWFTVRSYGQDCEERPLYSVTHWAALPSVPLSLESSNQK